MTPWVLVAGYFGVGALVFVMIIASRTADGEKPERMDAIGSFLLWPILVLVGIGVALGNNMKKNGP